MSQGSRASLLGEGDFSVSRKYYSQDSQNAVFRYIHYLFDRSAMFKQMYKIKIMNASSIITFPIAKNMVFSIILCTAYNQKCLICVKYNFFENITH